MKAYTLFRFALCLIFVTAPSTGCKRRNADSSKSKSELLPADLQALIPLIHRDSFRFCITFLPGTKEPNDKELALRRQEIESATMTWVAALKGIAIEPLVSKITWTDSSKCQNTASDIDLRIVVTPQRLSTKFIAKGEEGDENEVALVPTVLLGETDVSYVLFHELGHAFGLKDSYLFITNTHFRFLCQVGQPRSVMCTWPQASSSDSGSAVFYLFPDDRRSVQRVFCQTFTTENPTICAKIAKDNFVQPVFQIGAEFEMSTCKADSGMTSCVTIKSLEPGSAAARMGLQVGDQIIRIGADKVESILAIENAVRITRISALSLRVYQQNKKKFSPMLLFLDGGGAELPIQIGDTVVPIVSGNLDTSQGPINLDALETILFVVKREGERLWCELPAYQDQSKFGWVQLSSVRKLAFQD